MLKLSVIHKVILSFTVLLFAIWVVFAIVKTDVIRANDMVQSTFGILATLLIVSIVGFGYVIVHPDVSYTSSKINDDNRDKIYYMRRTLFCFLQLIYVFFLGGMSISMYYSNWRIGFSVVVPIFLALSGASVIYYALKVMSIFRQTVKDNNEK